MGLFRTAVLALCAGLTACNQGGPFGQSPVRPDTTAVSLLALGDSYTIGEGVGEADRWPLQMAESLRRDGRVADPVLVARTGWTTGDLLDALDAIDIRGPFGIVTLLIGVNNQYQQRGLEEYRLELRELLRRAVAFAGGKPDRVLALSIPDWGAAPFAVGQDTALIRREIDAFNAAEREEVLASGAHFVDITAASRAAAGRTDLFAADGLHYSRAMYRQWADLALAALVKNSL